jgi:hypothetical protein
MTQYNTRRASVFIQLGASQLEVYHGQMDILVLFNVYFAFTCMKSVIENVILSIERSSRHPKPNAIIQLQEREIPFTGRILFSSENENFPPQDKKVRNV